MKMTIIWILKFFQSLLCFIILILFSYYIYPGPSHPIIIDVIIGSAIALGIFLFHELLHLRKAKQLGYEVTFFAKVLTAGFDIEKKENMSLEDWNSERKQIAQAPYIIIIPISILLLMLGFAFSSLALSAGGAASLILHGIAYPFEGKESEDEEISKTTEA